MLVPPAKPAYMDYDFVNFEEIFLREGTSSSEPFHETLDFGSKNDTLYSIAFDRSSGIAVLRSA
jgi:hypothetical protein